MTSERVLPYTIDKRRWAEKRVTFHTDPRSHTIPKPKHRPKGQWPEVWDLAKDRSAAPKFHRLGSFVLVVGRHKGDIIRVPESFQQPISLGIHKGTRMTINNFPLYLSEDVSIWVKLPDISEWSTTADNKPLTDRHVIGSHAEREIFHVKPDIRLVEPDYMKDSYFAMLFGAYVASYVCGVSQRNLTEGSNMSRSLARFHLYYQIRSFIANPERLDIYKDHLEDAKKHIPWRYANTPDNTNNIMATQYSDKDYLSMIAYDSNGIRDVGLLQESIRAYIWCILGAQAIYNKRFVGDGKGPTDDVTKSFAKTVENAVNREYTSAKSLSGTLVSNALKAVRDTNAVVNLAITPEIIKMPSNMLFKKLKLVGYDSLPSAKKGVDRFGPNAYTKPVGPSVLEEATAPKIVTKPQPLATRTSSGLPNKLDPKERHIPNTKTPKKVVAPKTSVHKPVVVVEPHGSTLHKRDEGVVVSEPKKEEPKVVTERKPVGRFGQYSGYIFGGSIGAWAVLTYVLTR